MFGSAHLPASWVKMFVWTCRITSVHAVWDCGAPFPIQGEGKSVNRAHLSQFWSLKFMCWGTGALMAQSLVSSILKASIRSLQGSHISQQLPTLLQQDFYTMVEQRYIYPWEVHALFHAYIVLCILKVQCKVFFVLSSPFFHINREKPDYIVQEIKELTPRMFYPTQFPMWWLAPNDPEHLKLHSEIQKIKFWVCNSSSQSWGSLHTQLWK